MPNSSSGKLINTTEKVPWEQPKVQLNQVAKAKCVSLIHTSRLFLFHNKPSIQVLQILSCVAIRRLITPFSYYPIITKLYIA